MKKENGLRFLILALAAAMIFLGLSMRTERQKTIMNKNGKMIQLQIVFADGSVNAYTLETTQDTLGAALREAQLVQGVSEDGTHIKSVAGVEADETKGQWWCVMEGGEELLAGVDAEKLKNDNSYLFILRTGR